MKVNAGIITIIFLLVVQLVAFSFGYGMLTQQVGFNRELIQQYKSSQIEIANKLDGFNARLVKIETILQDK